MIIKWPLIFLCCTFSLLSSLPTLAQEPLDYLFKMSLEELLKVKVTGSTLTPKSLKKVPSAVTIFTHKEIVRMGIDSMDELMQLVPGFQSYRIAETAVAYTYSSRARRINSPASEILVLLDGQRLNEPYNGGSVFVTPKIPVMLIKKVEFIRGPGAAIYGSGAMMGVINIVTRSSANEVALGYGSLNRSQAYVYTSRQQGELTMDLFGYLDADDGEQYRLPDTYGPNLVDTDDPRGFSHLKLKLKWQQTQLDFLHYQFDGDNFYHFDGIANDVGSTHGTLNAVSVTQDFNWWKIDSKIRLGYNATNVNISAQLTEAGFFAGISEPASNDPLVVSANYDGSTETRLLWHNHLELGHTNSLQFGLELSQIHTPNLRAIDNYDLADLANGNIPIRYYGNNPVAITYQQGSTRNIFGLYSQYQHELLAFTHLTLGLRYDKFSGIGSQLSPRLGLVRELNSHHSLKLLYGDAFRAPTEEEQNLINNPLTQGNTNLKPETVRSWELIWVGQWTQAGLSLGVFENHFKDPIARVDIGGQVYEFQNTQQNPVKGIEIDFSYQWSQKWLLRTSYTHISDKPDISFREAGNLASFMLNYQHEKWNANLITSWQGERQMSTNFDENDRFTLPEYWQMSGKLIHNFSQDWLGYIQVKNLMDEHYLTPPNTANLTQGVTNRGREILTGLVWQY